VSHSQGEATDANPASHVRTVGDLRDRAGTWTAATPLALVVVAHEVVDARRGVREG